MTSENLPQVSVECLGDNVAIKIPARATPGSAGYDVCSSDRVILKPGAFARVPTGMKVAIPQGMEAQVRPRSGLAAKHGVTVLNAPGTIDSDYRGELAVILINHGPETFIIEPGMRIAQLIFSTVETVKFQKVSALEETQRGEGGFGSTGR